MSEQSGSANLNECDLIMKGGVTSAVVYPGVVTKLAKKYRFKNIGGTSAGAIGAGFAAAAEFNRQTNSGSNRGFEILDTIPKMVGSKLFDLFEPHPKNKRLLNFLLKTKFQLGGWWSITKLFAKTAWNIKPLLQSRKHLPTTYYGICTGLSRDPHKNLALTDWINLWLERTAGRIDIDDDTPPAKPLTFGDLANAGINLKTVTTNLSQRSPVNLPDLGFAYVKKKDLGNLMPPNVVRYVASQQKQLEQVHSSHTLICDREDYFILPVEDQMPVLLGIRLSLSFPILLSAFPIYRLDRSLRLAPDKIKNTPRVCWLSDGGITSNFPIHLFDSIFPSRPTFGISLGEWHPYRHQDDTDPQTQYPSNRVYLPKGANRGLSVLNYPFDNLSGFIYSIFTAAQTWQDANQTYLPGYRERVAQISLKPDEGGLNLNMEAGLIQKLSDIGAKAGDQINNEFSLSEHRWRRLLSAYAAIEAGFEAIEKEYNSIQPEPMGDFLQSCIDELENKGSHKVSSYKPKSLKELKELKKRLDAMILAASTWTEKPIRESWGNGGMPKPSTALKNVPEKFIG